MSAIQEQAKRHDIATVRSEALNMQFKGTYLKPGYVIGGEAPNGTTKDANVLFVDLTVEPDLDLTGARKTVDNSDGRPVLVITDDQYESGELQNAGVTAAVNFSRNIAKQTIELLSA